MTDDHTVENSFAYKLGRQTARVTRLMLVVFGLSIGGLFLTGNVEGGLRTTLMTVAIVFACMAVLLTAITRRQPAIFVSGAYILLVTIGSVVRAGGAGRPVLVAIAASTIVAGAGIVVFVMRAGRRTKELERMLFSEATSIAFFITMLGAITYGLLEAWLQVPKLSMWLVWTLGMGSWSILSVVMSRRYS